MPLSSVWNAWMSTSNKMETGSSLESSDRYLALDVFRGMTVALMILVNTPGSWRYVYAPLRHAGWHGCTLTDLVFPFFLFAAGVSIAFSLAGYQSTFSKASIWRISRRVLLIFSIGLFINAYPPWITDYSQLRVMGVLQRIALTYGMAAFIVLAAPRRWLPGIGVVMLMLYWLILYSFGGTDPYSLSGNTAAAFDRAILGEARLYRGFGIPFDPEGILSSLPATVTVLIGYGAGIMIKESIIIHQPLLKLVVYGTPLTFAGYLWGFVFPVNKPLWTGSYVLYTGGLAALFFALLIYIIDVKGHKKWVLFFSVFGRNALLIFALSSIWIKTLQHVIRIPDKAGQTIAGSAWMYQNIFMPLAGPMNGSLLYALAHIALFWLIGYALYQFRFFVKV